MKGSMDLITEDLPFIEEMTVCNILGSLYAENIIRGGHGYRLLASAVQRDLLMPVGKNAIDRFRGSLTIHDIMYPCTHAARQQWRRLGGPVMPVDWWLAAETQKEALAKRFPHPFNREGAVSYYKAEAKIHKQPTPLEKEKQAKALEWQRRKEEAEFQQYQEEEEKRAALVCTKAAQTEDMPVKECSTCLKSKKKWSFTVGEWDKVGERQCQVCTKAAAKETADASGSSAASSVGNASTITSNTQSSAPVDTRGYHRDWRTIPKKRKEEWRPSREQLAHVEALKRKRAETPLVISSTITKKKKPETIVMARKKQSLSFTITKPDSGRFGLTLCDLKVSHCGDINCTTKVMKVASGSAFEGTPLKTGMALEFINTYKCFSHERAIEALRKATGEIKIIAMLYT